MLQVLKQRLVWIAGIGYFVDLYDLVLFGVVRVPSLKALGIDDSEMVRAGSLLLNSQMAGLLLGGFLWGTLGDRRGRREVLFGSILIYSLATFLNSFVHALPQYAVLRFIAGIGLAGELGAAVTLVTESLPQNQRGYGSTLIATIGFIGALCAAVTSQFFTWQVAYQVGGVLGFILLMARMRTPRIFIFPDGSSRTSFAFLGIDSKVISAFRAI